MNTPAHVAINVFLLGRRQWNSRWWPIVAGSLLPDLPMFGFYAYEKLVLRRPEHVVWQTDYFHAGWQAFFDVFNALPLIGIGALIAWTMKRSGWLAFFTSMGLHCLADLPLHNKDAHSHFFPLSSWRFNSPVSYWDPQHYGLYAGSVEALLVLASCIAMMLPRHRRSIRICGAAVLLTYVAYAAFVLLVWVV